jgi:hypothetical protein
MFSIFYHFFVKCFDLHIPSASSARLSWLYPCSFPLGNRRIPHTCLSQRYFPRDLGFLKMFKSLPCPQRVQTFRLCFQLCTTSEQTRPPKDDSLTEKGSLQSLVRNGSIGIWGATKKATLGLSHLSLTLPWRRLNGGQRNRFGLGTSKGAPVHLHTDGP